MRSMKFFLGLACVLLVASPVLAQVKPAGRNFVPPFSSVDEVTNKAKSFAATPDSGIAAGNPITRVLFHANRRNNGQPYWEVHWAHPFTKNQPVPVEGHRPSSSLCLFKEGSFVPCPVHPKRVKTAKAMGAVSTTAVKKP